MANRYKRNKFYIAASAVTAGAFFFFYLSYIGRGEIFKIPYRYIIYPIQNAFTSAADIVDTRVRSFREYEQMKDELESTRKTILENQIFHAELLELRRENDELRTILGYRSRLAYSNIAARVISKDPQNLFSTLIVNKGSLHGVKKRMIVIAVQNGKPALVGNVFSVDKRSSRVQTIVDSDSEVGVMISATSDTGVLKGQAPEILSCRVYYLDIRLKNLTGLEIVTSGFGSKYMKGIFVGTISEVFKKDYGLFQEGYVEPYINFSSLDDVYILTAGTDERQGEWGG